MKKCAFTICSKNYLAQALTLKNSFLKHNSESDFYIFLADTATKDVENIDLELLDESWVPKWRFMAFKYEIIEFNTSIKPFCFNKLFSKGYNKVIYLDPDIYVTDSLDQIYYYLNSFDCVLTPHISYLQLDFEGAVPDTQILKQGLYNLGFIAIKNSVVGTQIIKWWMSRLENHCYGETNTGLFVDQKWMNFIPVFFPENVLITKHGGINVAIWNLHERELKIIDKKYYIKDIQNSTYPLLFYHFSGFDPDVEKIINRRHPNFNTDTYTSFKPLIEEYRKLIFSNNYLKYHKLPYSLKKFENGYPIITIQRKMLKRYLADGNISKNPFSTEDLFYQFLLKNKLIWRFTGQPLSSSNMIVSSKRNEAEKRYLQPLLNFSKNIIGIRNYQKLCVICRTIGDLEYLYFIISKEKKNDT